MAEPMSQLPPQEFADWLLRDTACQDGEVSSEFRRIAEEIDRRIGPLAEAVCDRPLDLTAAGTNAYRRRWWRTIEFHWSKLGTEKPLSLAAVLDRLERMPGTSSLGLLGEVTLAEALEQREQRAAELFERDFMPLVRATAQRTAGPAAVDLVENFAADLILPREARPPRIASYEGRTPLAAWLKAIVVNVSLNGARRKRMTVLPVDSAEPVHQEPAVLADRRDCEKLLRPVFADCVSQISVQDRVLLKMLILDAVPQKDLAQVLGINTGTLGRRRQKAAALVWQAFERLAAGGDARRLTSCLETVLAGDSTELRSSLAEVLASNLRREPACDAERLS